MEKKQKWRTCFGSSYNSGDSIAALPSHDWIERERWRAGEKVQGVKTALRHWLSKLSCQFPSPFIFSKLQGTWPALNLSCWQECCMSCSIFLYWLAHEEWQTWTLPLKPSIPQSLFIFVFLVPFQPWTSMRSVLTDTMWGMWKGDTWNFFFFFFERKWFCVSKLSKATVHECVSHLIHFLFYLISICLFSMVHFLRVSHICAYVD